MPDQGDEAPKIQIDSDWKAQAQAEKEKLREDEEAAKAGATAGGEGAGAGERGEFPPASWDTLMGSMVSQTMMYMGAYADPQTGQPMIELNAARHYVDLLSVLEEKTKGNLDAEEAKNLATVIYELRMRYVQLSNAVAGVPGGGGGGGGGGGIGGGMGGELGGMGGGMGGAGASNIGDLG